VGEVASGEAVDL